MLFQFLLLLNVIANVLSAPTDPGSSGTTTSLIVVTASTGTPPTVVTYSASRISSLSNVNTKTVSNGTTIFPFGWIWVPLPPPGGPLPTLLPTPPPEATPSEDQQSTMKSESACTSTGTPTVTVIVSYPTNSDGIFQTSSETQSPSGSTSCTTLPVTSTSTAPFDLPTVYLYTGTLDGGPIPTSTYTVDLVVQRYLNDGFNSLGIGTADYAATTTSAKATCADSAYESAVPSAAAFVSGLMPSFCSDWSAKPTDPLSKDYSAKDVKTISKRTSIPQKRTPPPAPLRSDSYPGWSVTFDWKPGHATGDCLKEDYCNKSLSSLLSHCEGYSLADAYKSGSTEDGCGTFSYDIKGYEGVTCDLPTVIDRASDNIPRLYPQSAYEAAAHQFCYAGYYWNADPHNTDSWTATNYFWFDTTHLDPATNLPAYCIGAAYGTNAQISPASAKFCQHRGPGTGLQHSDSKIWVQVVPSPVQEGCSPIDKYKLPEGDQCYNNLMNVVNKCMSGDGGGKVGVWKESTSSGCWDWWMWGRVLT